MPWRIFWVDTLGEFPAGGLQQGVDGVCMNHLGRMLSIVFDVLLISSLMEKQMAEMKFCRDCKWCRPHQILFIKLYEHAMCVNPKNGEVNYVEATVKPDWCSIVRKYGPCYKDAVLWEAKNV